MLQKFYRYAGILAIAVVGSGIITAYALLPDNHSQIVAISDLGVHDESRAAFGASLAIGALLSFAFFRGFIEKNYGSDLPLRLFYITVVGCQLIVAVPGSPSTLFLFVHWTAALTLGFAMVCVMIRFAITQSDRIPPDIRKTALIPAVSILLLANAFAVIFLPSFAATQILTILVLWYWIIRVTFLSSSSAK